MLKQPNIPANEHDLGGVEISRNVMIQESETTNQPPEPLDMPPNPDNSFTNGQATSSSNASNNYTTIYISSSMFRGLCEEKMSSFSQKAAVFYYPGATAGGILSRLKSDTRFARLKNTHVSKIFLLCGTNNVHQILGVKPINRANFIQHHNSSTQLLNRSKN